MILAKRREALNSVAGSLSQEIARRVARAVEIDRFANARSLPQEMMLRPVLERVDGSERTPTPLRFFCMPFEDLFSDAPRTEKHKGCIARSGLARIWTWIGQSLLPLETKIYCRAFKSAIVAADHAAGKAHAANFWAIAADAMHAALADQAGRSAARRILRDDLVLADAEEIALLLGVAPAIVSIQETLARATPELTDEHLQALRAIHDRLLESDPDAAPYVALIARNRIALP